MAQDQKETEEEYTINCKIDPDVEHLDEMHKIYDWIPGKENVRPSPDDIQKKVEFIENKIGPFYGSEADYILEEIFKFDSTLNEEGKLIVKQDAIKRKIVFEENRFPYSIDSGHHYILWYSYFDETVTEDKINEDIRCNLQKITDKFEYVWYENPKMTIPDIYHVQVFWTSGNK